MTRQQSEGEVHVEAMRLILAEMERREDIPDWTIWQHMLNMLETIFQGIVDQRADDAGEIETLRKELAATNRFASTVASERDAAHAAAMAQQRDETVYYLQTRLDKERSVIAGLRQQLDAAQAAVTLQRAGIERLQAFVGQVREAVNVRLDVGVVRAINRVIEILAELDAATEPTPVAEPLDAEGGA